MRTNGGTPAKHGFRAIFSDIGGVLGTNGWDSNLRRRLYTHFQLDGEEIEPRHKLMFDSYERGYMDLDQYLDLVFFATPRSFTIETLRAFVLEGSQPWHENIEFLKRVRLANGVKLALISNEGEGITGHRIKTFGLRELADFMVVSHFTGLRKPDPEIWKLALNLAGMEAQESIYIDDRPIFAQVATSLGFLGIHHQTLEKTAEALASAGLQV